MHRFYDNGNIYVSKCPGRINKNDFFSNLNVFYLNLKGYHKIMNVYKWLKLNKKNVLFLFNRWSN